MPQSLPQRLPETGPFRKLYAWLNQLRDTVATLMPRNALGTRTSHTALGVTREASAPVEEVATSGGIQASPLHLVPRGEWHSSIQYSVFDMVVIVGGPNAGTYYAADI